MKFDINSTILRVDICMCNEITLVMVTIVFGSVGFHRIATYIILLIDLERKKSKGSYIFTILCIFFNPSPSYGKDMSWDKILLLIR